MPLTVTDVVLGLLVPAGAAFLVTIAAARCLRRGPLMQAVCPLAVTGGFLLGYWLLKLGPIVPQVDRDWVPYAAVCSLAAAVIPDHSRRTLLIRLVVLLVVVILAACVLVPTWSSLKPSRTIYMVAWSLGTYALGTCLLLSARGSTGGRESPRGDRGNVLWVATMAVTLAFASALLALSGSLRFAQTTAAAMAAFLGLGGALWKSQSLSAVDAAAVVYAVLISAALLTGKVNSFSDIPTVSYFMLPWAPLSYGLVMRGGRQPITIKRAAVTVAVAVGVCTLALGLALVAEFRVDPQG